MTDSQADERKQARRIEEIMRGMECPKDFRCYKSEFRALCRARDVGLKSHLECLEKQPARCSFSVPFGHAFYCRCPVRIYVAKALGK